MTMGTPTANLQLLDYTESVMAHDARLRQLARQHGIGDGAIVRISGAAGPDAKINGVYTLVHLTKRGSPLYAKR